MGTRHLYWILTGPSFAVYTEVTVSVSLCASPSAFRYVSTSACRSVGAYL
jgi:hypothetical protein